MSSLYSNPAGTLDVLIGGQTYGQFGSAPTVPTKVATAVSAGDATRFDQVAMVKLATGTASNSAAISFSSLPSGYSAWKVIISNLYTSTTNTVIQMRYTSGGTITSGYWYVSRVMGTDTGFAGLNSASDTTFVLTGLGGTNTLAGSYSAELTIENPSSTTTPKGLVGHGNYQINSGVYCYSNVGGNNPTLTSALDGLYFFANTGNLTAGTITVYGIR